VVQPLKRSLNAFVASTQEYVSGDIRMTLHGGAPVVTVVRSETSLYDFGLATYDELDTFDAEPGQGLHPPSRPVQQDRLGSYQRLGT